MNNSEIIHILEGLKLTVNNLLNELSMLTEEMYLKEIKTEKTTEGIKIIN